MFEVFSVKQNGFNNLDYVYTVGHRVEPIPQMLILWPTYTQKLSVYWLSQGQK